MEKVEGLSMVDLSFYKGRRVLITGHTGFKGTWLSRILLNAGAELTGYSLPSPTEPALYRMAEVDSRMNSVIGDIRDLKTLHKTFKEVQPEIVFHMAAQPIVRESYRSPRETYEINVMGTVNILECIRLFPCVKSVVNITTDKVYQNHEWCWGYRETEPLNGFDPYSNSKSCSELVTHSYRESFFSDRRTAISTTRAGNVIGGGDFAKDRIIPDCIRAVGEKKTIEVRNPYSIRPYQHVLEPLMAYLLIAEKQFKNEKYAGSYNVGPDEGDCLTTGELVDLFCYKWGEEALWKKKVENDALHEASYLKLDCSKLKTVLGWKPRWNIEKSVEMVCRFHKVLFSKGNIPEEMDREIDEFLEDIL